MLDEGASLRRKHPLRSQGISERKGASTARGSFRTLAALRLRLCPNEIAAKRANDDQKGADTIGTLERGTHSMRTLGGPSADARGRV